MLEFDIPVNCQRYLGQLYNAFEEKFGEIQITLATASAPILQDSFAVIGQEIIVPACGRRHPKGLYRLQYYYGTLELRWFSASEHPGRSCTLGLGLFANNQVIYGARRGVSHAWHVVCQRGGY